ncbi:MAG: fructoselysine kinase [Anaerolineae bacterium]|nr:fructoselysine kinase [Anaerolineae bacterium]
MRIVGVGDNTVDRYLHLKMMFPGGNAVNVPVLARRYGHEASYIGWLGDDPHGRLIMEALVAEGLDVSHCRMVDGPNAYGEVSVIDGDRVFGHADHGVTRLIALEEEDLAFVRRHDLTHTSIYSHLERDLPKLSAASRVLSFDYSQEATRDYLSATLPYVTIALLSCPGQTQPEAEDYMRWVHQQGPSLVVATRGKLGSLVFDGDRFYAHGIAETEVIDTLGAGDAYAARFLVEYLSGTPIPEAMASGALSAAETCRYYGAFGYGIPIP